MPALHSTAPPPSCACTAPSRPAMLRPEPCCLLLLLLLHGGRATTQTALAPLNVTEGPRAAAGNGTQPRPGPLPGLGLPVLKRALYVLSALSALAALYFLLRAVR